MIDQEVSQMVAVQTVSEDDVMLGSEARRLTERIKAAVGDIWQLLLEAYRGHAWKALDYPSWRAYAQAEFGMSEAHAYRLLDQAKVMKALEEAVNGERNSPNGELPRLTEKQARDIKPRLDDVEREIRERVAAGEDPATVVPNVVERIRNEIAETNNRSSPPTVAPPADPSVERRRALADALYRMSRHTAEEMASLDPREAARAVDEHDVAIQLRWARMTRNWLDAFERELEQSA